MIRLLPERGGWLEVVCGPMFSGKSEELIRRLRRAEIAGQRALIVKPRIDDRYDIGHVVSHAGAKMRAVAVSRPADRPGLAHGYHVNRNGQAQFFTSHIVPVINGLVALSPAGETQPRSAAIARTATAAPGSRRSSPSTTRADAAVTGETSSSAPRTATVTSSSPPCRSAQRTRAETPSSAALSSVEI